MAAVTVITRGVKETQLYFNRVKSKLPTVIGASMSKLAKEVEAEAKANLEQALHTSDGATGLLVSSIKTKRIELKNNRRGWKVFIVGRANRYAPEIEYRSNLPMTRQANTMQNWINRVESQGGQRVPISHGGHIRVGYGQHPRSLWTNPSNVRGVRFMERAGKSVVSRLNKIDSAVTKGLR